MKSKVKQIKSHMKQILMVVAGIAVMALIYVVLMIRYADSGERELRQYTRSIEDLPEVEHVINIQRFNGIESYVVVHVMLVDGQEFYYFVRDETVKHYVASDDLIGEERALRVMNGVILDYDEEASEVEVMEIQLGVIDDEVIFEIRVRLQQQVHYVVINGLNGEVLLHFNH